MTITVDGSTSTITGATSLVANTVVTGTFGASGAATLDSTLAVNGNAVSTTSVTMTAFAGATTSLTIGGTGATAVVAIPGTLDWSTTTGALTVAGGVYIAKKLQVVSDFSVATNKFTVAAASGNTVVAGTLGVTGIATFSDATDASNSTTGGTVVTGGLAVAKKAYIGTTANIGGVLTAADTTDATSSTAGGTIVSGGLAVAKKINIGTDLAMAGVATLTRSTNSTAETVTLTISDTRSGAAATGWAAKFALNADSAMGSYTNAAYGLLTFGASGAVSGLAAGVCAETVMSAGCTAGTYACLELEMGMPASSVTGTATSFMYVSLYGANAAAFDTSGYLFQLAGYTKASGKFVQDTTSGATIRPVQVIKVKTLDGDRYLPLYSTAAIAA